VLSAVDSYPLVELHECFFWDTICHWRSFGNITLTFHVVEVAILNNSDVGTSVCWSWEWWSSKIGVEQAFAYGEEKQVIQARQVTSIKREENFLWRPKLYPFNSSCRLIYLRYGLCRSTHLRKSKVKTFHPCDCHSLPTLDQNKRGLLLQRKPESVILKQV